ncbi:hypothetical protein VSDG_06932 [Cytospora chrysosperma]|uniref:Helicase ATP-binding domain-containing protein n=1 Tax=Cytospora chrysosperma TaxID=252740 RepID=A0A423VQK9_CYTCH|nr:hypothetical protein VSDG_06932 [Valsa sordida]
MASSLLQKAIPNEAVLQTLKGLQDSQPKNNGDTGSGIIFLQGEPNCGNTSRIPLALSILQGDVTVVSIQPTDAAAAYACNIAKEVIDVNASVCHVPQSQEFNTQIIRHLKVWYISARQFLLHSDEILRSVSVVILDEIHYNSVNHELSAVLLRERLQQKDSPVRARIVLMSSYIRRLDKRMMLFKNTTTIKLGRPDGTTLAAPQIHYDSKDRENMSDYTEMVISTLRTINPADGIVLVFVPEKGDIAALRDRLRKEKIVHRRLPQRDDAWDHAVYLDMNDIETSSPLKNEKPKRSIIIALPYHHTHRNIKGLPYKHVIFPHWLTRDTYSEDYGKEMRRAIVMSKGEMRFLMAHSQQVWLSCTKSLYDTFEMYPTEQVLLVDPMEYYCKAHYLFKDRSPHSGTENELPLRFRHDIYSVVWVVQRLVLPKLVVTDGTLVSERAILNDRGRTVVEFMLELDLKFNWALFLTNIRTYTNDEQRIQHLFDLFIPLAIVMSKQEYVLRPRAKDFDQNRHISDAMHFMKNHGQPRDFGDAWCGAKCLSLFLSNELDNKKNLEWVVDIPENLERMVERARSLPHVTQGREGGKEDFHTHDEIFVDQPEPIYEDFLICLCGSVPSNLACVMELEEGIDDDGNTVMSIGKAMDMSAGKEVMLSRESLIDLSPSKDEIPLERLYVTYDRIQHIEPRDDDSVRPITLMIPLTSEI